MEKIGVLRPRAVEAIGWLIARKNSPSASPRLCRLAEQRKGSRPVLRYTFAGLAQVPEAHHGGNMSLPGGLFVKLDGACRWSRGISSPPPHLVQQCGKTSGFCETSFRVS
jgi:hypothetical protein